MNDGDWLRKHLRGKVQRRAVDGGEPGLLRRLVYRSLKRLRSTVGSLKAADPQDPDKEKES